MPVDAFVAHLRMFAQELVRQRQRCRIVFELGKDFCFALRIIIPSQLAIDQHQVVMRPEIFRINSLIVIEEERNFVWLM